MKKIVYNKINAMLLVLVLVMQLCGCSNPFAKKQTKQYESTAKPSSTAAAEEEVKNIEWDDALEMASNYMERMSIEEKIGQLFIVNLEQLDLSKGQFYEFTKFTKKMKEAIDKYHVGGVILFSKNIENRKQTKDLTKKLTNAGKTPLFVTVDEEGGRVARIATNAAMHTTKFPSAEEIGKTKDTKYAYDMAKTIGGEIRELGFNVDFAPVADVRTSDMNMEIGDRSFGDDPDKVSEYVTAFIHGLSKENIASTIKHFPGQGSSKGDTHINSVDIDSSIARLRKTDFVPFEAGIDEGVDLVMVSHISVSKVTESSVPASMSDLMMKTILREELGFQKIIITDAFNMASITQHYTAADAAYRSIKAGADIVLMPENMEQAYNQILVAVKAGTLDPKQIDESVLRILAVKIQHGILTEEQLKQREQEKISPNPTTTPKKKIEKKKKESKKKKKNSKKKK